MEVCVCGGRCLAASRSTIQAVLPNLYEERDYVQLELTAHFDVSRISTSVVTLSKVTLCLYRKSETEGATIISLAQK